MPVTPFIKLVWLRRKGATVRGWDADLDRGFEVADGEDARFSEVAAASLLRDEPGGWEVIHRVEQDGAKQDVQPTEGR